MFRSLALIRDVRKCEQKRRLIFLDRVKYCLINVVVDFLVRNIYFFMNGGANAQSRANTQRRRWYLSVSREKVSTPCLAARVKLIRESTIRNDFSSSHG